MAISVPALSPADIRQIGIRSVDEGEKRFVHEVGIEVFDMRYIDETGMRQTLAHALSDLPTDAHLHVSFDVDFLDLGGQGLGDFEEAAECGACAADEDHECLGREADATGDLAHDGADEWLECAGWVFVFE